MDVIELVRRPLTRVVAAINLAEDVATMTGFVPGTDDYELEVEDIFDFLITLPDDSFRTEMWEHFGQLEPLINLN